MALAELTLEDILEDKIGEAQAIEATAADEAGGSSEKKYRIRKGEYAMKVNQTRIKEDANGRRYVTIIGALENAEGTYRGTVFPEISWQFKENQNGKLDLKSRLFGNLVHALQAPAGTPLPEFLDGIMDEYVLVYVSENFRISYDDLLPEDKEGVQKTEYKTLVFINEGAEGDAKAKVYLALDYKSQGMVLSIKPINID